MISYKPFLKMLIDKEMKKQDLVNAGVLSWTTMAKIDKNQKVSLDVIEKICKFLNCQPGDLFEYIPDEIKTTIPRTFYVTLRDNPDKKD